ncbi:MAG: acyl-CoA thioesterase [Gammaproteobacteria bacterium]|nr:acyl-CoA thioesterase [Gammaproteobacteria bacterium]
MIRTSTQLEIPFHDVDSMGIVWHGHYFKYFEIARCRLLDQFEFGYRAMADSDYSWPVVDSRIKFIRPVTFEQLITVQAELKEWDLRLKIDYLITDSLNGERLTRGHTIQAAVDRKSGKLCLPLPDIIGKHINRHLEIQ